MPVDVPVDVPEPGTGRKPSGPIRWRRHRMPRWWTWRAASEFRDGHIPGALWGVRTRLEALRDQLAVARLVVLTSPDGALARLAVAEAKALTHAPVRVLEGGTAAWVRAAHRLQRDRTNPPDDACIDVYLRPYDRNSGIEDAMQAYLVLGDRPAARNRARRHGGVRGAGGGVMAAAGGTGRAVWSFVAMAAGAALDLLLPPHCLTCDAPVDAPGRFCPDCFRQAGFITEPCCARCGVPFAHAGQGGRHRLCPACRSTRRPGAAPAARCATTRCHAASCCRSNMATAPNTPRRWRR